MKTDLGLFLHGQKVKCHTWAFQGKIETMMICLRCPFCGNSHIVSYDDLNTDKLKCVRCEKEVLILNLIK